MKKFIFSAYFFLAFYFTASAQDFNLPNNFNPSPNSRNLYGLKAGINISSNPSYAGAKSKLGFMCGILADKSYGQHMGLRSEITYSREGFHFRNATTTGTVDLQYINFTNLGTLNIGDLAQLQLGLQIGYLARAMADTARRIVSTDARELYSVTGQVQRVNYGGCVGVEIYPWRGLLIGARYISSFSTLDKKSNSLPVFNRVSESDNNPKAFKVKTIQISLGWRFGGGINKRD